MAGVTVILLMTYVYVLLGYEVVQVGDEEWGLAYSAFGWQHVELMHTASETVSFNLSAYLPDYGLQERETYLFLAVSMACDLFTYATQPVQLVISLVYSVQFRNSFWRLLGRGPAAAGRPSRQPVQPLEG
nr:hypothetical protein BaRGS_026442 [Batillaria attramentaria]